VWWSVKVGNYWAALVLALLAVLILLRLLEQPAWRAHEAAGLGFVIGLAWWANPQSVYLIAPALLFAVAPALRNWRVLPAAALGTLIGAFPWIAYNVRNNWLSLHFPSGPASGNSYFDHLEGLFRFALPMALGLRESFTRQWVLGIVGTAVYLAVLSGFAALALRRPRALRLPLVIAVAFPFLYAISPMTWYVDQPRYVLFLAPAVCVLVAAALRTRWLLSTVLAVALALTATGTWQINSRFLPRNYAPDVAVPADLRPLEQLLRDERVETAFADYWLAYRIMFETEERVTVTPVYTVRHRQIDQRVRNAERPAYVFVAGATPLSRFLDFCQARSIPVSVRRRDSFVLVQPARRVLPEEVPGGWGPAA
jgi:hypothetical protein